MDILSIINAVSSDLSTKQVGELALLSSGYASGQTIDESGLDLPVRICFHIISAMIDEQGRRRKQLSEVRSAAGKLGGRGRKSSGQNEETESKKSKESKIANALFALEEENSIEDDTLIDSSLIFDGEDISEEIFGNEESKKSKKANGFLLCDDSESKEIKETDVPSSPKTLLTSLQENRETIQREKEKVTKVTSKKKGNEEFDFPTDERFLPAFRQWIAFKKEKGQTYKPTGLKTCYKRLVELSGGDPEIAEKEIVEFSISNNYTGLFRMNPRQRENVAQKRETGLDVNERYNPDDYNF